MIHCLAMDATHTYFAAHAADPGPLQHQVMSPTAIDGASVVGGRPVSFGPRQMPISYGATAAPIPARQGLANGVVPRQSEQASSQLLGVGTASASTTEVVGIADGARHGSVATGLAAYTIAGSDDDVTARLGVGGRVEQAATYQPTPQTSSTAPQQLPHPPATQQQQQQQRLTAEATTAPAEVHGRAESTQAQASVDMSPGTRLSIEAQRAMAQLSSQRTALVQALQSRAARAITIDEGQSAQGADQGIMRGMRLLMRRLCGTLVFMGSSVGAWWIQ